MHTPIEACKFIQTVISKPGNAKILGLIYQYEPVTSGQLKDLGAGTGIGTEFVYYNMIKKSYNENGKVVYSLTSFGRSVTKELTELINAVHQLIEEPEIENNN